MDEYHHKLSHLGQADWLKRSSLIIAILCCLITFGYGILVLCGKQPSEPLVSQIGPTAHIMVYDTAISFCIASLGLLAIFFRKNYITLFAIVFLIVISILTIVQYFINAEWDLTRRMLQPLVTLKMTDLPGKMKPITPFCFLLTAMALLHLIQRKKQVYQKYIFAIVQAVIILCLAILFLFGYTISVDSGDHMGNLVILMTTNAAIGFIFLGIGIIFTVIYLDKKRPYEFNKSLPLMVAAFIAVLSLISWKLLYSEAHVAELLKKIHWLTSIQEIFMALLIGIAIYFFQKTYLYHKNFKRLYAMTKATLNATHDGILVVNSKGEAVDFNQRFLEIWDLSAEKLINNNYRDIFNSISIHLNNFKEVLPLLQNNKESMENLAMCEMELKDGRIFEFYVYPQHYSDSVIGFVYSFHDITHLKLAEGKLLYQATHDVLTNLANRFLLLEHINKAMARAKRENNLFAILFIDLDGFKLINDSLSHVVGDKVLKAVADRFMSCTRSEDTLARIGGDEFILLAVNLKTKQDAEVIANKYLQKLGSPFYIDQHELHIRCSIGISVYPDDGKNYKNIVENADTAMYFAKKNPHHVDFYTKSMHEDIISRLRLENDLPHAIEQNELELYYQPIVDLTYNKICDTEALIRWNHPTRGLLLPIDFIPIAEETGIINAIGNWVLKKACAQNKLWQDKKLLTARISVNISTKQLQNPDIFKEIANILHASGLDPSYLQLELTESRLIPDIGQTAIMLNKLKQIGLKMAIDDFGTGYTGLGYLINFPLDKIKIDKSLMSNIATNLTEKAIVGAIINMCKELSISSCVEGVENAEQYQYLCKENCNEGQGHFFSHPLTAHEYEKFIDNFSTNFNQHHNF